MGRTLYHSSNPYHSSDTDNLCMILSVGSISSGPLFIVSLEPFVE